MHGLAAMERRTAGVGTSDPNPLFRLVQQPSTPLPAPVVQRYDAQQRPNWIAVVTVLLAHGVLLMALVQMEVIAVRRPPSKPLAVNLLTITPPPPPQRRADPKPAPEPEAVAVRQVQPEIVSPPPVVPNPSPAPVAVTASPPAVQATVVVAEPVSAAPTAPVAVDLSSRMISAKPPLYPTESRRKREQGVVVLRLLLGLDGRVEDIAVARSSGFERLDKAALQAVRRWRWSPTMQAGHAVEVRGLVEIPFVLES